jgi:oligopeptide transport system ATP-binding protein
VSVPPLLAVRNLKTYLFTRHGVVRAVDGVSFDLAHGETLALVGESGSGKTMLARSLVRLTPEPPARTLEGEVLFEGNDVLKMGRRELYSLRGHRVGFVFQDPMTSLNPVHSIGTQIAEPLRLHLGLSRARANDQAAELLSRVGFANARRRLDDYPHQLSGGMRQRVMIAMALACKPKLLIADEPTTALDVTIQAQILELIQSLTSEIGTAVLLITHNLGIAAGMCNRIQVMYAGHIVESGKVDDVFYRSRMPYTWGLLDAVPDLEPGGPAKLAAIEGSPPDLRLVSPGCRFEPRCRFAQPVCAREEPQLIECGDQHVARCHGTEALGWIP